MNNTPLIAPIVAEVLVNTPREFAFDVFVKQGSWWPMDTNHIGQAPPVDVVIEPRAGGRWFERDADGNECPWGGVVVYEPPTRLVLDWKLNGKWQFDPDFSCEVEVRFIEEGPESTRVVLEHKNLEQYGEQAEKIKASIGSDSGWNHKLRLFADRAHGAIRSGDDSVN